MEDFEGSIVLENLARIGKVDEFCEAVDADDFSRARKLMKMAGVDPEVIKQVLNEMGNQADE